MNLPDSESVHVSVYSQAGCNANAEYLELADIPGFTDKSNKNSVTYNGELLSDPHYFQPFMPEWLEEGYSMGLKDGDGQVIACC